MSVCDYKKLDCDSQVERINSLERRTASDILGLQRISVVEVHARTDIRQYYPAGWMPTVRRLCHQPPQPQSVQASLPA